MASFGMIPGKNTSSLHPYSATVVFVQRLTTSMTHPRLVVVAAILTMAVVRVLLFLASSHIATSSIPS